MLWPHRREKTALASNVPRRLYCQRVCQPQRNLSETGVAKAHMFAGWRVRLSWAAALLIRSRKDLFERLRDHAVAGGIRMDVAERAEPCPVADVCGTVHQVVVFERACDVGDGIARRGVRVDEGRVKVIDAVADERQRWIGNAERREHIVVGHGHDRDVWVGRAELGQDRAQVLHHPRGLCRAASRLEQAGDFVTLRVQAEEVVRPDVDRDERDLVFVRLEKADRLRKLRAFRIKDVRAQCPQAKGDPVRP
jgi:hypothetical protein